MSAVTAANVLDLSRRHIHRLLKVFQENGAAAISPLIWSARIMRILALHWRLRCCWNITALKYRARPCVRKLWPALFESGPC